MKKTMKQFYLEKGVEVYEEKKKERRVNYRKAIDEGKVKKHCEILHDFLKESNDCEDKVLVMLLRDKIKDIERKSKK